VAHFHKIPAYLDCLVVGSISSACRAVGIDKSTHYSWLIRSKQGDEALQAIEWLGTTAPFHVHVEQHVPVLAIQAIESAALERARDGCWIPSVHQGAPVFLHDERIIKFFGTTDVDPDLIEMQFGQRDTYLRDEEGNRVQARTWLKPDTGLVSLMLSAWKRRRYGTHVSVESKSETVLRLERPEERTMKTINAKPVSFGDDEESTTQGAKLALGRPAASSEEFDQWAAQGEFAPAPVTFVDQQGNRTQMVSAPDPLTIKPDDRPDVAALKRQAAEALERAKAAPALQAAPLHDAPTQPAQQPRPAVEPERRMKLV
jgi:hypothetical protein